VLGRERDEDRLGGIARDHGDVVAVLAQLIAEDAIDAEVALDGDEFLDVTTFGDGVIAFDDFRAFVGFRVRVRLRDGIGILRP
jgi:hypothetical protein